jgi:Lipase (class 3)
MTTYDQTRTVFTLSMISNLGSGIQGTVAEIESKTYQAINAELSTQEPTIGRWSVIWGPAVYQAKNSDVADNVMVAFRAGTDSAIPGQIVVGIAGTDPHSGFDWIFEDFLVVTTRPWETGNRGNLSPRIALGTSIGLSVLQSLVPGPGLPGVGVRLPAFLRSALSSSTLLTIAGHSLGGALSPAMTLFLSDTKPIWDPSGFATLRCLPSAGPTSGDRDFATYYNGVLGQATTRLYNSLDVVPHTWQSEDLVQVPDLYSPAIPPTLQVFSLAVTALGISAACDYTQIDVRTPPLQGKVNTDIIDPSKSDCDNFTAQVYYQHVQAYFELLGIVSATMSSTFAQATVRSITAIRARLARVQMVHQCKRGAVAG